MTGEAKNINNGERNKYCACACACVGFDVFDASYIQYIWRTGLTTETHRLAYGSVRWLILRSPIYHLSFQLW
jgi:hypothetical protein